MEQLTREKKEVEEQLSESRDELAMEQALFRDSEVPLIEVCSTGFSRSKD